MSEEIRPPAGLDFEDGTYLQVSGKNVRGWALCPDKGKRPIVGINQRPILGGKPLEWRARIRWLGNGPAVVVPGRLLVSRIWLGDGPDGPQWSATWSLLFQPESAALGHWEHTLSPTPQECLSRTGAAPKCRECHRAGSHHMDCSQGRVTARSAALRPVLFSDQRQDGVA